MTRTGYTNELPDSVFVIKKTENTIQLSTSRSDAMSGIALTFTDRYEYMEDQTLDAIYPNKKCIILIDGITQSPLAWTPISYNLTNNLSGISTEISLTGISSIRNGDILKIGSEFVELIVLILLLSIQQLFKDPGWELIRMEIYHIHLGMK